MGVLTLKTVKTACFLVNSQGGTKSGLSDLKTFRRKCQIVPERVDFFSFLRYNIPRMLQKCYNIRICRMMVNHALFEIIGRVRCDASVSALL